MNTKRKVKLRSKENKSLKERNQCYAYIARWKILSYIMPEEVDIKKYSTTPFKKRQLDTISDSANSSSAGSGSSANNVKETCFSYASTLTPAPKKGYFYLIEQFLRPFFGHFMDFVDFKLSK